MSTSSGCHCLTMALLLSWATRKVYSHRTLVLNIIRPTNLLLHHHRRTRADNYKTYRTGVWHHQSSQAQAVYAHAPTYVPAVADHFCLINSLCHCRGECVSNVRLSTRPRQQTPEEALAKLMSSASLRLGISNVAFSTRH